MKKIFTVLFFFSIVFGVTIQLHAFEYIIAVAADLPDDDLTDNIWSPRSLRAAIQNINKEKIPAVINLANFERETFFIESDLPTINFPVMFKGKKVTLEPSLGSTAKFGLWFTANTCDLQNIRIHGFNGTGLVWQGSDGFIAHSIFDNNNGPGINMNDAHRNIIGDENTPGYFDILIYGNKGNAGNGLAMIKCNDNVIQYCRIGIDSLGVPYPNDGAGIHINEGLRNKIHHNTISGNTGSGIFIDGSNSPSYTYINLNYIGTSYLGDTPIPNNGNGGVEIFNSQSDSIINNTISGNKGNGIYVATNTCKGIDIENNRVGTDRFAQKAIPNGVGIRLNGFEHRVVNNVISGNTNVGLSVTGMNMVIKSNIVGLNSEQKIAIPNGSGIAASTYAGMLVVGDTVGELSNVIAGNNGNGVTVAGATVNNVIISHNVIGANRDTSMIFPNKGSGVIITHNLRNITVKDNLISANTEHGIRIERNVVKFLDTTKPNLIQKPAYIHLSNNCIGCSGSNNAKLGKHGGKGISILNADSIFIDGNNILGTKESAIDIANDSTRYIFIKKNILGTETNIAAEQLIGGDGITVHGSKEVFIGDEKDSSERNIISKCKGYGVSVQDSAQRVFVYANSFRENELGGIALDNLNIYFSSVSNDDVKDEDTGSNGLINTVIHSTDNFNKDSLQINGTFHGKPNNTYSVNVYIAKKENKPFEIRTQGSIYLATFPMVTDANGNAKVDTKIFDGRIGNIPQYNAFTTTVSGLEGTSPFSILPTDNNLYIDIQVQIDTSRSFVDDDGNIKLVGIITNSGNDVATTVSVRDSVSNFDVKEISISKGVIGKYDSTVVATIPQMLPGESVTYTSYGKATTIGTIHRKVIAIPSEVDKNPENNRDSISFIVKNVNNSAPIPKYPLRNTLGIDNPLQIIWYSLKNVEKYHLQVTKGKFGSAGNTLIINDSTLTDTSMAVRGLEGMQTYYWRVRGINANNEIIWSDTSSFTTVQVTEVEENNGVNPLILTLSPNPVDQQAEISVYNYQSNFLSLSIVNNLGQDELQLNDKVTLDKGEYKFIANTSTLSTGMYYIRLITQNSVVVLPMLIVR
ncbi:MAG: right-handed parallel beta-helix repeat-containing protein [Bacteroidetes bacterium]|nr:right-handed parallel beta-helix repeat-containing protein [Bacteroidota bacterium]